GRAIAHRAGSGDLYVGRRQLPPAADAALYGWATRRRNVDHHAESPHFPDRIRTPGQDSRSCLRGRPDQNTGLFAGLLTAAAYFDHDTADEAEVRRLADLLYRRADWNWAHNDGPTLLRRAGFTGGWL